MRSRWKGIAVLGCVLVPVALAGCGEATVGSAVRTSAPAAKADPPSTPRPHQTGAASSGAVATSSSKGGAAAVAREVAAPLEASSSPALASVQHASAATPAKAGAAIVAAGA